MIGKDDNSEDVILKVDDKRKFNVDGSLREGVEIEPESPKTKPVKPVEPPKEEAAPVEAPDEMAAAEAIEFEAEGEEEEEIPGANDPASFVNFLTTLASQAAAALGAVPHPVTGQRSLDLEGGRYWIDILAMLQSKTKGNLHPQEARLLEGLIGDLRMQYVQLARVAEDKLKQQAAQKFSGQDILGKK